MKKTELRYIIRESINGLMNEQATNPPTCYVCLSGSQESGPANTSLGSYNTQTGYCHISSSSWQIANAPGNLNPASPPWSTSNIPSYNACTGSACDFTWNGNCAQTNLTHGGQNSFSPWLTARQNGFNNLGCFHFQKAFKWILDQLYNNAYTNPTLSTLQIFRKVDKLNWLFCMFACEGCSGSVMDHWNNTSIWAEGKSKGSPEDKAGFIDWLKQWGVQGLDNVVGENLVKTIKEAIKELMNEQASKRER